MRDSQLLARITVNFGDDHEVLLGLRDRLLLLPARPVFLSAPAALDFGGRPRDAVDRIAVLLVWSRILVRQVFVEGPRLGTLRTTF